MANTDSPAKQQNIFTGLNLRPKLKLLKRRRVLVHAGLVALAVVVIAGNFFTTQADAGSSILFEYFQKVSGESQIVETAKDITRPQSETDSLTHLASAASPLLALTQEDQKNPQAETQVELNQREMSFASTQAAIMQTATPGINDYALAGRARLSLYEVRGGDTVSSVASQFNLERDTICWANNLSGDNPVIQPGDKLTILPFDGVHVKIEDGDTLAKIAEKYKGDIDKIVADNDLMDEGDIKAGEEIIIRDGEKPAPPPPPAPAPQKTYTAYAAAPNYYNGGSGTLAWPVRGSINQYYRGGHRAIDIGLNTGQGVYSAASGTVTAAGWSSGYGKRVVVSHGNGMSTLYAHFSSIGVSAGQHVGRGQYLGGGGCTGWCTGPHLHFEVIAGGVQRNPLHYL